MVGRVGIHLTKNTKPMARPKQIRKIIKSSICPSTTHGRAGGRASRPDWSGGSGSIVFCPPLIVSLLVHDYPFGIRTTQKKEMKHVVVRS